MEQNNERIPRHSQAEATTDYLSNRQWGTQAEDTTNTASIATHPLTCYDPEYNTDPITEAELVQVLANIRNNKAAGPDGTNAELLKWLPSEMRPHLLNVVNHWWNTEQGPTDITDARIASIYKKGNPAIQENYRPISLLCALYKVVTNLIQQRLAQGIERDIQDTQYGFRVGRSTTNAIHTIRRIMDRAERTGEELGIIFLLKTSLISVA